MAEIITMPQLSDTMEEGTVAQWLKKVGDKVEEGDILAEIETDKATMEFESFYEGTLLHIGIQEGEGAPVDSLLAIIGEEGEDISQLIATAASSDNGSDSEPAAAEKPAEPEPSANEEVPETETADPTPATTAIPEGVEIITMPRLSDTMEEGTVASWLKQEGDLVEEGDILAEIETDKATMEFESFYSGTLLHIGIQEGESAPVDDVLAIIGPAGTDVEAVLAAGTAATAAKVEATPATESQKEESIPIAVEETSTSDRRIFASPLAKKMAVERGIALDTVTGTGEQGRIIKRDIENYTPSAQPVSAPSVVPASEKAEISDAAPAIAPQPVILPVGEESSEEVKNSQMRKIIAKRLGESKFTAPHYYLTIELDMSQAKAARAKINDLPDTKVSFNDMVLKACALALRQHPQVNTTWNDDTTIYNQHIHLGVAVAVDEGLVVPVLKFADQLSLTQIGSAVKDLAGRARNKKIKPDEMEGSTFTVSNLGMFGILEFTSIINQPNSAILSVGAIVDKPVVRNGEIVVGSTMKLTLACDHRTVDGVTGAQFLQTLRAYVENPVTMLA